MNRTRILTVGEVRSIRFERAALYVVFAVAAVAALISFFALRWVAIVLLGISPRLAWGYPIIIDGLAGVASAATIALHAQRLRLRAYVWLTFALALAVSIAGNALHALQTAPATFLPTWGVAVLAAIPPVSFATLVHLYIVLLRRGVGSQMRSTVEAPVARPRHRTAPAVGARERADRAPTPRASLADNEKAYAEYARRRQDGEGEMTGIEIAALLECTPGNARKVRERWRTRYLDEYGLDVAPEPAAAVVRSA